MTNLFPPAASPPATSDSHRHLNTYEPATGTEVEECWQDFWLPILGSSPSLETIKAELHDYHMLLADLPELYETITGSAISKPHTVKSAVLNEYYANRTREIEEALAEHGHDPATCMC